MSTPAHIRLMRDFQRIKMDPPEGITASPTDNLRVWNAIIFGPDGTIYEDGIFKLTLTFPVDYPDNPPIARFDTKVFHPNVSVDGKICLDILKSKWSAAYNVCGILISIQALLLNPNPNSPANPEASRILKSDKKEYEKRVKAIVEQSITD